MNFNYDTAQTNNYCIVLYWHCFLLLDFLIPSILFTKHHWLWYLVVMNYRATNTNVVLYCIDTASSSFIASILFKQHLWLSYFSVINYGAKQTNKCCIVLYCSQCVLALFEKSNRSQIKQFLHQSFYTHS